eukprot:6204444-Pleurochrysis_carterae.AAC.1
MDKKCAGADSAFQTQGWYAAADSSPSNTSRGLSIVKKGMATDLKKPHAHWCGVCARALRLAGGGSSPGESI